MFCLLNLFALVCSGSNALEELKEAIIRHSEDYNRCKNFIEGSSGSPESAAVGSGSFSMSAAEAPVWCHELLRIFYEKNEAAHAYIEALYKEVAVGTLDNLAFIVSGSNDRDALVTAFARWSALFSTKPFSRHNACDTIIANKLYPNGIEGIGAVAKGFHDKFAAQRDDPSVGPLMAEIFSDFSLVAESTDKRLVEAMRARACVKRAIYFADRIDTGCAALVHQNPRFRLFIASYSVFLKHGMESIPRQEGFEQISKLAVDLKSAYSEYINILLVYLKYDMEFLRRLNKALLNATLHTANPATDE
ncbi:hypothetical protein PAPHI01_1849 [Pancytospora philotis]|nr:hypothetical protein PAPHI01_1849 [Pancytospora philotis]